MNKKADDQRLETQRAEEGCKQGEEAVLWRQEALVSLSHAIM